ncbi:hypothetical protein ACHAW6_003518 [Cyclotella cf. meneghiniana]
MHRTLIVLTVELDVLSWLLAAQCYGFLICRQKLLYLQWRPSMWHSVLPARI